MSRSCVVFISSTVEDLKEYRQQARDAALPPDSGRRCVSILPRAGGLLFAHALKRSRRAMSWW